MSRRVTILIAAIGVLLAFNAIVWWKAQPDQAAYGKLSELTKRDDVRAAVARSNALTTTNLRLLDTQWRREAAAGNAGPLIDATMATPLSRQLFGEALGSGGHIVQIMVMDARGALVAADKPTHDYDQSDEPKWQRTVGAGETNAVFEGTEKARTGAVDQMSQVITARDGKIIGAVTLRWAR